MKKDTKPAKTTKKPTKKPKAKIQPKARTMSDSLLSKVMTIEHIPESLSDSAKLGLSVKELDELEAYISDVSLVEAEESDDPTAEGDEDAE